MRKSLKVLCALALFATVPTVLTACGENSSVVDENQEMVDSALKELTVNAEVSNNFTLVVSARGGVAISWVSNNEAITINGSDAIVNQSTENDISVKLTATATKGNATGTRDFTIVVKQKVIDVEYSSISDVLNAAIGSEVKTRGIVTHIFYNYTNKTTKEVGPGGFNLSTVEGTIYCYGGNTAKKVSLGDDVIVSGKTANYPTSVTYVTQLGNIDLISTVRKNATLSFTETDLANYETKTVTELQNDLKGNHFAKTYIMRNVRINKFHNTSADPNYTSMSLYDWEDTFNHNSPSMLLYSSNGQGENTMSEYDWLSDYFDKKVDIVFAVNSQNSGGTKWRGAPVAVLNA